MLVPVFGLSPWIVKPLMVMSLFGPLRTNVSLHIDAGEPFSRRVEPLPRNTRLERPVSVIPRLSRL